MNNFSITQLAKDAKQASIKISMLKSEDKRKVLLDMANELRMQNEYMMQENKKDLIAAQNNQLSDAMIDRLRLTVERIEDIALAIEQIADQDDPVGKVNHEYILENNLKVQKMSIPLGVIAMIYESRPNVTADAAALCFKAGNAVILRGGKEAIYSNLAIGNVLHQTLKQNEISEGAIGIVSDPDRKHMAELLHLDHLVDLIIPRGGESLIRYVSENSRIPVIQHFKGVCHLYIDKEVDIKKALSLLQNGKVQRPGVCNALETLLIHKDIVASEMTKIVEVLKQDNIVVHACEKTIQYFPDGMLATEKDYDTEYLALEITVKQVDSFDEAIQHILQYSSDHTEVIATENELTAKQFVQSINSSVVMVNASSRFSDGGQLGLGAEIGISTSKLHAYGPMGVQSLTTEKFVVLGDGQIRD
ncbi:MAG: glutamate-5-semialdehyde dehydrogenase [Kangiellaceae bacterium]|nr:glutamate-5-semialdehyde dehydrogenase [Kangiellaceae bacterium]